MNLSLELARISRLATQVLAGGRITFAEASELMAIPDARVPFLLGWADVIRKHYRSHRVDICAIINARAGRCSEDCRFCAQAAYYHTDVPIYPLRSTASIVAQAKRAAATGIRRLSIVTSGRSQAEDDFDEILTTIRKIKKETSLLLCASLGFISPEQARALKNAGLTRYHHNLETAPSFFPQICTTHTLEDRIRTISTAREAGLEICTGGIIGLGETPEQRVELAFTLKKLEVSSIPVNILHPIPGTPLENQPPLSPLEILRTLAVFRLILPQATIRYAGGREANLRDLQVLGLAGGIDGLITGDYLTTPGQTPARDFAMIRDLGLEPEI
jgi:biotin synthase